MLPSQIPLVGNCKVPGTVTEARDINDRGDVLGYSLFPAQPTTAPNQERIGVWRGKTFQTWFVQGTTGFL